MTIPNTFIVGAPRCGTTALQHYLSQHPDIFMSDPKEPHHFGRDLWTDYTEVYRRHRDRAVYLSLFESAGGARVVGEASVWYLYSSTAAAEIHAFNPDARILINLRHPVDYMHSLHQHMRVGGEEDIDDFVEAIDNNRDSRERQGRAMNGKFAAGFPGYRETAQFSAQVARFLDAFGRDRVHFVLMDDLQKDTPATVQSVCRFLGVDSEYDADYSPANESRVVRRPWLHKALMGDFSLRRRLGALLPERVRVAAWLRVREAATLRRPRGKLDPAIRRRLTVEFTDEIKRLGEVIERDLDHWLA